MTTLVEMIIESLEDNGYKEFKTEFGVWKVIDKEKNVMYYAILYEYIENRPAKEIYRIMDIVYELTEAAGIVSKKGTPLGVSGIEKQYMRDNFNYDEFVKQMQFILTAKSSKKLNLKHEIILFQFIIKEEDIKFSINFTKRPPYHFIYIFKTVIF